MNVIFHSCRVCSNRCDYNPHTGSLNHSCVTSALVLGIIAPAARLTNIWPQSTHLTTRIPVSTSVSLCSFTPSFDASSGVNETPQSPVMKSVHTAWGLGCHTSPGKPWVFPEPLAALGLFHTHAAGLWIISLSRFHQTKPSPQCLDMSHLELWFFFSLTSLRKDQVCTEPSMWWTFICLWATDLCGSHRAIPLRDFPLVSV